MLFFVLLAHACSHSQRRQALQARALRARPERADVLREHL
jgi:hypothetical protein